jgi:hypothetical protein
LIETDASTVKQRADPVERVRRDFVCAGGRGSGNGQSTVGPGQIIVPEHDKLLAYAFNLDLAPATSDGVGLDRQQFPITWRLGDVTNNGQISPVETADDLAALVDPAGCGQKNRLPDDRLASALGPEHVVEILQRILGLLAESAATLRDCRGKDMMDVIQLDGRQSSPLVGSLAHGVRGHSEFLHAHARDGARSLLKRRPDGVLSLSQMGEGDLVEAAKLYQ